MKILIADDEPLARERLRRLLQELEGNYRVVAEVEDGEAALRRCATHPVDLVLLDVRMPLLNGLETAGRLAQSKHPPAVVFVAAHDEFAPQAFERQALDYLVKPVRRERLRKALERARPLARPQLEALRLLQDGTGEAPAAAGERICASFRGRVECVPVDQVRYFQADQKYVVVHHPGGELLVEDSLKSLEKQYGERFLRVHRNALVAKRCIQGIRKDPGGRHMILLHDQNGALEISRRHLAEVRAWLKDRVKEQPDAVGAGATAPSEPADAPIPEPGLTPGT